MTESQIHSQLLRIRSQSWKTDKEPMGILTSEHRHTWGQAYNRLLKGTAQRYVLRESAGRICWQSTLVQNTDGFRLVQNVSNHFHITLLWPDSHVRWWRSVERSLPSRWPQFKTVSTLVRVTHCDLKIIFSLFVLTRSQDMISCVLWWQKWIFVAKTWSFPKANQVVIVAWPTISLWQHYRDIRYKWNVKKWYVST